MLGETGAVAIQYEPEAPFKSGQTYLSPGSTIHTDDIQLYSTRFGPSLSTGEYELQVVFWQPATGENGTQYADAQRKRSYRVTLSPGYDRTNVTLPSQYDTAWKTTMWLTKDGVPVDGARWVFTHQTVSSERSLSITSFGDLWEWLWENIFMFALPGILLTSLTARGAVRRAGKGPQASVVFYATIFIVAGAVIATVGYFHAALLAYRVPQLFGILLAFMVGVLFLEMTGPTLRRVEFIRDELEHAESPLSDKLMDVVKGYKRVVYMVRREDNTFGLIKKGWRPFTARLFAEPARLTTEDLTTYREWDSGPHFRTFFTDPKADHDGSLKWVRAHWQFNPSLFRPPTAADSDSLTGLLGRFRALMVIVPLGLGAAAYYAGMYVWSIGWPVAAVGAALGFIAVAFQAQDGHVEFDAAAEHYMAARKTIAAYGASYEVASTLEDAIEEAQRARVRAAKRAKAIEEHKDTTISREVAEEELGIDLDFLESAPDDLKEDGHPELADGDGAAREPGDSRTDTAGAAGSTSTREESDTQPEGSDD